MNNLPDIPGGAYYENIWHGQNWTTEEMAYQSMENDGYPNLAHWASCEDQSDFVTEELCVLCGYGNTDWGPMKYWMLKDDSVLFDLGDGSFEHYENVAEMNKFEV